MSSTTMDDFRNLLRTKGFSADVLLRVSDWQHRVGNLCGQIEAWLAPLVQAGELKVERGLRLVPIPGDARGVNIRSVSLDERTLRFLGISQTVTLVPAPLVLDRENRVDVICGAAICKVYFAEGSWVVRSPVEQVQLTETVFVDILTRLLRLKEAP